MFDNELVLRKFRQYQDGDRVDIALRNELAELNKPLVHFLIARHYSKHMRYMDDMVQEGMIGLLRAVECYDVYRGYQFSTYACWWVRQAVNSWLHEVPLIHLPSHVRSSHSQLMKLESEAGAVFEEETQGQLTKRQMAAIKLASFSRRVVSLNMTDAEGRERTKALVDGASGPEYALDSNKLAEAIQQSLTDLDPKELGVVLLRFGVLEPEDLMHWLKKWTS
jgi:RNA polymerase sigma factor (sigma-70 family)